MPAWLRMIHSKSRSRRPFEVHPLPDLREPAAGVGRVNSNPVVVDEHVPERKGFNLLHAQMIVRNPVDQFLLQCRKEFLIRSLSY